jgi:hypothetical protein
MVATAQGSPASVVAYVAKNTLVLDYHALSSLVAKHRYDRSAVRCTTTTTKHISRAGGTLSADLGTDGALDATHHRTHASRAPNTSESPFRLQVRRAAGGAIYSITKSQGQPEARSQSPAVLVSLAITPDQPPQPPHAGCCPSISVSASAPPWQRIQPPARRGTSSSSPKGTRSQALHQLPTPLSGPTILFVDRHVDMPPTQVVWC